MPTATPAAEDVVIYATGQNGQGRSRARGQIVQYTGEQLVLRQTSGGDAVIATSRVVEIQTAWTEQQMLGDRFFADRKFDDALAQYRLATNVEGRRWARRGIMAQIVWCYRARGETELGCSEFLNILASDPTTQYFDAIPLAWGAQRPTSSLQRRARSWLGDAAVPSAKLMAASWLLATDRTAAIQALRQLTTASDSRVALLAEVQLWRADVVTANEDDVARWRGIVGKIPKSLRAGPYYTIGRALARQQQHEQAALALMRVPILYGRDFLLSADALLAAANELVKIQQRDEARNLYGELVTVYASTRAAQEAQGRLQGMTAETPN